MDDLNYAEDHDYPFAGTKHLDPIGINVETVNMSSKFIADFEPANKLKDPEAPLSLSFTKYEKYLKNKDTR